LFGLAASLPNSRVAPRVKHGEDDDSYCFGTIEDRIRKAPHLDAAYLVMLCGVAIGLLRRAFDGAVNLRYEAQSEACSAFLVPECRCFEFGS
jgi:hypothetical protein